MRKVMISLGVVILILVVGFIGVFWYLGDEGGGAGVVTPTPTISLTSPTPVGTSPTPDTQISAQIFLVAIGDGGSMGEEIGCGDSLVGVSQAISGQTLESQIQAAYSELFALDSTTDGDTGYYNSLSRSDLTVDEVTISDSVAEVDLSGSLSLGGVCDNPRAVAQLEAIPLQFDEVQDVEVRVNGEELSSLVSGA